MVIWKCAGLLLLWLVMLQIALSFVKMQNGAMLVSQIIMLILAIIFKKKNGITWNKKDKINKIYILGAVFTGIGIALFNEVSVLTAMTIEMPEAIGDMKITLPRMLMTLSAAAVEEIFFRGTIMNLCRTHFKAGIAILISALFFCIGHLSPVMLLHTFVCGILCGCYYYYSGNIVVPITIHFVTNFIWGCLIPAFLYYTGGELSSAGGNFTFSGKELATATVSVLIGITVIAVTAILIKKYNRDFMTKRGGKK